MKTSQPASSPIVTILFITSVFFTALAIIVAEHSVRTIDSNTADMGSFFVGIGVVSSTLFGAFFLAQSTKQQWTKRTRIFFCYFVCVGLYYVHLGWQGSIAKEYVLNSVHSRPTLKACNRIASLHHRNQCMREAESVKALLPSLDQNPELCDHFIDQLGNKFEEKKASFCLDNFHLIEDQ